VASTLTSKGQVTIPKKVRDALRLAPGSAVEFAINDTGEIVLRKVGRKGSRGGDRLEALRGSAQIKWRTSELMALLRG
jgi:antitoxin PrlF